MKRSEMLRIIVKELDKNFDKSKNHCSTSAEFAGIAHDILYRLEEAGMLPPECEIETFMFSPMYKNEWEPENE